jgi:hypothetical protein
MTTVIRIYHVFLQEYSSRVERKKKTIIKYSNNLIYLQEWLLTIKWQIKEQILKSALELFANEGLTTSTNKIAKQCSCFWKGLYLDISATKDY